MGEMTYTLKNLIKETPEDNTSLAGPRRRREDNTNLNLKETGYKGVD